MSQQGVLGKVLAQCREAMLGGIPIVYIKTDSDIFIEKLVTCETDPLVVLLSKELRIGSQDEQERYTDRPVYELPDSAGRLQEFYRNYKRSYPSLSLTSGLYDMKLGNGNAASCVPFLWVYKMLEPLNENHRGEIRNAQVALEQYVIRHENPTHPQYEALQSSLVIVYSSTVRLTPALEPYVEIIDVKYPEEEEIRELIKSESGGDAAVTQDDERLTDMSTKFFGFTEEEIVTTMRRIMGVTQLSDDEKVQKIIRERKVQKLESSVLELCDPDGSIGGMEEYRKWLNEQSDAIRNSGLYARTVGVTPPKGVLLCGIPGCGKSEAAKFTAKVLDLPLIKMDMGSVMDKYVGESERKMRDALAMVEAMAPCVLWIDELEKGFSGAGSDGDSSTFKRMFGYMLGWMQDNKKPCFIVATANDIGALPKEFFRSGRFEALFSVYLPTASECEDIFITWMKKTEEAVEKAAKDSGRTVDPLFDFSEAERKKVIRGIIESTLVDEHGTPRIVIGSDIAKIVQTALRKTMRSGRRGSISAAEWQDALYNVIKNENFSVYGDSEENVESIAVSYCRMLRKQFIPTASKVLFDRKDYRIANAEQYQRLKRKPTDAMSAEEREQHEQRLRECEVLQKKDHQKKNDQKKDSRYDRAVYQYMRRRINEVAPALEMRERDLAMMR